MSVPMGIAALLVCLAMVGKIRSLAKTFVAAGTMMTETNSPLRMANFQSSWQAIDHPWLIGYSLPPRTDYGAKQGVSGASVFAVCVLLAGQENVEKLEVPCN